MVTAPFTWTSRGAVTPAQLERERKVAAALQATAQNPKTFWEGAQSAIGDIGGSLLESRASADEAAARSAYGDQFTSTLSGDPSMQELIGLAGNEWGNDGQSAVVQALLGNQIKQGDPSYQMDLAYKQAQIDALNAKPAMTAPDVAEFYDEQTGQPYKAVWNPSSGSWERQGGVKAPPPPDGTQLVSDGNGGFTFQSGNVSGMPKLTEGQSKDTVYITRAAGALPIVDELGDNLTSLMGNAADKVPYGRYLQSEEYQKASQAGDEFLSAILRKDTGAAITKEEQAVYGTVYLPQPGDKPGLLAQKKAARQRAVKAISLGLPASAILALEQEGVTIPALPQPKGTATPIPGFENATIEPLPD